MSVPDEEVGLYIKHAHEMLNAAEFNISGGFYGSAVNRAYYAIFYAASALLVTQGLSRSRHMGVIAVFRQRFVKPGLIETEYGDAYGRVMDDRHVSDYDVEATIEPGRAQTDLDDARRFVDRAERYLELGGFL
jgi:uncharacterized protein (UPF0332 family)